MQINQYVWDIVNTNSYLLTENRCGLLIDVIDSEKLYCDLRKLDELTVILTHSHFDHICGLNKLRKLMPEAKIISTRLCSENIGNIYRNMSSSASAFMVFYNGDRNIQIESFICEPADVVFDDKLSFEWCGYKVEISAFHGHSKDSLIAVIDGRYMFSGDTILPVPTVTRFPGGSTAKFWEEDIQRLKQMNVEKVFPGHGHPGNLTEMIAVNKRPEKFKNLST